jgi:outer membrane protein OmpA-like peptidoglycan-associated protein
MSRKEKAEESPEDIPLWVVSFTDMITLLLAFFVLLQSFAHEPDPEKFYEGQGSFKRAIESFGLPVWDKGKQNRIRRDWFVRKHAPKPDPESRLDVDPIDEEEERLQRIFQEIRDKMDANSLDLRQTPLQVTATPLRFAPDSANLRPSDQQYLARLAVDLQGNVHPGSSSIYLVGLAPDRQNDMQSYILSTRRAEVVEAYLRRLLVRSGQPWTVYAWGAGRRFGRFPDGTRIGVVVMGEHHGR